MRVEWGQHSRTEVARAFAAGAIAAVAIGSLEQHGDHLPTDTDSFLAAAATRQAADRAQSQIVELPPVPYGVSSYHARFGGTAFLSGRTLLSVMCDICDSIGLAGARGVVIVNGHGGNEGLLSAVSQECSRDGFAVASLSYWQVAPADAERLFCVDQGSLGHAGQAETSLMLALRDDLVLGDSFAFEPGEREFLPMSHLLGRSGVVGNPTAASALIGQNFFEAVVIGLTKYLDSFASHITGGG